MAGPVFNMPSATTAVMTDAYISTFDIHKPSKRNILYKRWGNQGLGFFATIETLGFVEPVAQTNYSHYEEDFYHETFTVNGNVSDPGTGNAVSITISPTNVDPEGYFYVRVNDDVLFPNYVVGKVVAINTQGANPVLTVEPAVATDDIGALADGQEISIYSNGWPEDTDQPDGRVSKVSEFSFGTKILKEAVIVSGSEMTNMDWFDKDSDGNSIAAYYLTGQRQADYRMMLQIDGASLFDKPITNPRLLNANQRNMTGLIPWMIGNAPMSTYTPGLFNMSNIDFMIKSMAKNFAPNEFLWMNGITLSIEMENMIGDNFEKNPVIFAGKPDGSTDQELNIGFKTIKKSEYTFHLKRMDVLSNPKFTNINGYTATSLGLVVPLSYQMDPNSHENIPSVCMRYKERNGYSRKMEMWVMAGAGNTTKNITRDRMAIEMRTEMGTEFFGSNNFYLWKSI